MIEITPRIAALLEEGFAVTAYSAIQYFTEDERHEVLAALRPYQEAIAAEYVKIEAARQRGGATVDAWTSGRGDG
jgi:hypothetical protein